MDDAKGEATEKVLEPLLCCILHKKLCSKNSSLDFPCGGNDARNRCRNWLKDERRKTRNFPLRQKNTISATFCYSRDASSSFFSAQRQFVREHFFLRGNRQNK